MDYGKYKSETPTPFVEDLPTGIALIQYYKGGKGPYSGTGFRVGEKYIMTAYHVFRERIGKHVINTPIVMNFKTVFVHI